MIVAVASALATALGVVSDLGLDLNLLGGGSEEPGADARGMEGTYNIAVSDFVAIGDDRDDEAVSEGQSLAGGVYTGLDESICAEQLGGYDIECRGPSDVPAIVGDDAAERAEQAAEVAERLNADVLVYGTVSSQRGQVSVQPAIYLAARRLPQLEELAGAHELVSAAGYVSTGQERHNALDTLQTRILNITIAMFTLDKYNLDEADEAEAFLEELTADEDWDFDRYILELITGNVWAKQHDYPAAIQHYDKSRRLYRDAMGDTYSRATVGKAEATYHQLRVAIEGAHDCDPPDLDQRRTLVDGLVATLDDFAVGRAAAENEDAEVIARKADYGTGRVQACLAQAGESAYWQSAENTFTDLSQTLEAMGESEEGLTPVEEDMLAESHSFLGFVNWQRTDLPRTPEMLQHAVDEYQQAADVTHHADRRQVYLHYAAEAELELATTD